MVLNETAAVAIRRAQIARGARRMRVGPSSGKQATVEMPWVILIGTSKPPTEPDSHSIQSLTTHARHCAERQCKGRAVRITGSTGRFLPKKRAVREQSRRLPRRRHGVHETMHHGLHAEGSPAPGSEHGPANFPSRVRTASSGAASLPYRHRENDSSANTVAACGSSGG